MYRSTLRGRLLRIKRSKSLVKPKKKFKRNPTKKPVLSVRFSSFLLIGDCYLEKEHLLTAFLFVSSCTFRTPKLFIADYLNE